MKHWYQVPIGFRAALMLSVLMAILSLTMTAPAFAEELTGEAVYDGTRTPRMEAPATSNPYFYGDINPFAKTGYYGLPNCTCYAWGRAYEYYGTRPNLSNGNAGEFWYYNLAHQYYEYGTTPRAGAVVCWDEWDQYNGHVAFVEQINDDGTVTISDSSWRGYVFRTRIMKADASDYLTGSGYRFLGYIYVDVPYQSGSYSTENAADLIKVSVTSRALLRSGSRGADVAALQTMLNQVGYACGSADGIFGSMTGAQVLAFQRDQKLSTDGIAGQMTWKALYSAFEATLEAEQTVEENTAPPEEGTPEQTPEIVAPPEEGKTEQTPVKKTDPAAAAAWKTLSLKTSAARPTLRKGSVGIDVTALQYTINALGFDCGAADGGFGTNTFNQVVAFQRANHLDVDGIVGPMTWKALYAQIEAAATGASADDSGDSEQQSQSGRQPSAQQQPGQQSASEQKPSVDTSSYPLISNGSRGSYVTMLQNRLNALGYNCGSADGIFGTNTTASVKSFQRAKGLVADGYVGQLTWKALYM